MKITKLKDAYENCIECLDFSKVKKIRETISINPQFSYLDELHTIQGLFDYVKNHRKKSTYHTVYASTSMWTVEYMRNSNKYKKNEKFVLTIRFSPVEDEHNEFDRFDCCSK